MLSGGQPFVSTSISSMITLVLLAVSITNTTAGTGQFAIKQSRWWDGYRN